MLFASGNTTSPPSSTSVRKYDTVTNLTRKREKTISPTQFQKTIRQLIILTVSNYAIYHNDDDSYDTDRCDNHKEKTLVMMVMIISHKVCNIDNDEADDDGNENKDDPSCEFDGDDDCY